MVMLKKLFHAPYSMLLIICFDESIKFASLLCLRVSYEFGFAEGLKNYSGKDSKPSSPRFREWNYKIRDV